jgi:protease-4
MGLILYISIIFSPFFNSVSTSIRSGGAILNPAGLGIKQGFEFYSSWRESDDENIYYYSISTGNIGFSFIDYLKTEIYTIGIGIPIGETFSFGYSYSFGDINSQKFGLIITPVKVLRFGAILDLPKNYDSSLTIGTSLRPFTDRITFSADYNFWNLLNYHQYQGVFEIFDGIYLYGGLRENRRVNKERRYFAGIEISFGKSKIFSEGNIREKQKVKYSGGFMVSNEIYPSIFPKKKKWVKIYLEGNYPEEREIDGFLSFKSRKSFYDLIEDLRKLSFEKDVEGIILCFKNPNFTPSQGEEIYNLLKEIKSKGKKIVSIGESFGIIDYMVASISSKIIITPTGDVFIPGLYMENIYLKDLFEKIGIEVEVERVGKYKSAVEPFIRENMSEEDRYQRKEFLKDVHDLILKNISEGRNIQTEKVDELMGKGYFNSENALKEGLVDAEGFERDIEDLIEKWFGEKPFIVNYEKIAKRKYLGREFKDERKKIAIIVGEGGIVTGESSKNPIPLIGGKNMGSETMKRLIEKVEKDKSIKAVVFRVNSPGGSALASEIIWDGIKRLREKKPVVVSMGQVAASGGYYISCPANKIYANKTTLTGSIGILGIKFSMREFFNKIGINFDTVKTKPHADFFSSTRKFTEEEREIYRKEIEWGYWQFVKRVSISRGIKLEKVDSLGQGRIYSGSDAKDVKIVDEIGGIIDAIEEAKKLAKIKGDVKIEIYPTPKWWHYLKPFEKINLNSPIFTNEKYIYMLPFYMKF